MYCGRKILPLVLPWWIASCASPPAIHSPYSRHLPHSAEEATASAKPLVAVGPPPGWAERPPQSVGVRYFVGESHDAEDKDEALEKAWISAFVRIGLAEFPELASLSAKSVEDLKATTYQRRFALRLEYVNWSGIREATELGSPWVSWDQKAGHFTVFRLLKWTEKDIEKAHARLEKNKIYHLPTPPESAQEEEEELVASVQKIQGVNEHIAHRNAVLDSVLSKVKCGVTIADLIRIIGAPDRYNPLNQTIIEKEYFWGPYRVERVGDNPAITAITREDGHHARQVVCPSSLPPRLVENE